MTPIHTGSAPVVALIVILGLAVLGGAGYLAVKSDIFSELSAIEDDGVQTEAGDHPEVDHGANEGTDVPVSGKTSIVWKFTDMDFDANNTPHTEVTVIVNWKEYVVGTFEGTCSEVGASGGVDGKGLLAGELSAAQCWFAGGGDEIGVFAHEDGGYQIMVGSLSEPDGEGSTGFRGDFKIKTDIRL